MAILSACKNIMFDGLGLEEFALSRADSDFPLLGDKFLARGTFFEGIQIAEELQEITFLGASENDFQASKSGN